MTALLAVLGSVVTAGAAAPAAVAGPGGAKPPRVLPVESSADIVVDGDHRRVFISDPLGGKVVVTDYRGRVVGTIPSLPGVLGLELSKDSGTVYAAAAGADAVVAIDTARLKESARYPTGPETAPSHPALTGNTLWFGYGRGARGNIGSIDLSGDGAPVVTLERVPWSHWYEAPVLASTPGEPDVLAAGSLYLSPSEIAVYDVSGGTAKRTAYLWADASNTRDLALSPDGDQVVVASGAPYHHQVYRTSDLTEVGRYPTAAYPNAVDIASDGSVAAGVDGAYEPDVYVFRPGGSWPIRDYNFGQGGGSAPTLQPAGLAWTPDRRRLFALTRDWSTGDISLEILTAPTRPAPRPALRPVVNTAAAEGEGGGNTTGNESP
ncbi:YncE family protein [Streptomyces sp. NPDC004609]|uniref:YncE family protein n=1 Tax=Streptomyces sp. NPDC004609 TaxID=3364704 RepID=UPI0036888A5C